MGIEMILYPVLVTGLGVLAYQVNAIARGD